MRANRLHAGGFSGVGLGLVLPEIRVLEAPLLFATHEEIDYVKERMFDDFAARFEEKGYVLLGFAEAGFVYLFSKQPIDSVDRLQQTRMWVWKGDRVAENFLEAFGVQGYPLQLADVNTGLETGMIDSFYSPPLASVAFQWYARVRYMLDFPMVNSTGALLMNKRTFYEHEFPENRDIVSRLVGQYSANTGPVDPQGQRRSAAGFERNGYRTGDAHAGTNRLVQTKCPKELRDERPVAILSGAARSHPRADRRISGRGKVEGQF